MSDNLDFQWITIPAGKFVMGISDIVKTAMEEQYKSKIFANESPQKEIYVDAFKINAYPITNKQYKSFIDATNYQAGAWIAGYSEKNLDHPARYINFYDALAFCSWAKCRLPTRIEWEKAGGGVDGLVYPWGNQWNPKNCNHNEYSEKITTTPVGSFSQGRSPYGLFDMAGNVWEWTSSTLISDRTTAIWWALNSQKWKGLESSEHPIEGYDYLDTFFREWPILKGGGADSNKIGIRCSFCLTGYKPYVQGDFFGFRCVKAG